MGRKANRTLIGAFIVGAVLLAVAGSVVLSGGRFLGPRKTHVAYFDGSLDGLDIGSPVTFNGVRIGAVTDIKVVIEPGEASIRTPVVFAIDARRLHTAGGARIRFDEDGHDLDRLIAHGLRARLELQSLVTGQLAVALNFYPGTPARLQSLSTRYPEVPTIPSSFETLTKSLASLPLDTLATEAIRAMRSIEAVASAPELRSALAKVDRVLTGVDGLVTTVTARVDPAMAALEETAAAARSALAETRSTMTEAQAALARLAPAAGAAIADYQGLAQDGRRLVADTDTRMASLAASVQATLDDARSALGDDSPVRDDLAKALQEITRAARALRTLADALERHPEALLVGKRPEPPR